MLALVLILAFAGEPPTELPWSGTLGECQEAARLYLDDEHSTAAVREQRRAACMIAARAP